MLQCFLFPISPLPLEDLLHYKLFKMILVFHLLIMQATTWVLVPLGASPNLLWDAAIKAALFRGLLHINAARRFGGMH